VGDVGVGVGVGIRLLRVLRPEVPADGRVCVQLHGLSGMYRFFSLFGFEDDSLH
jgi:hypothetical protein